MSLERPIGGISASEAAEILGTTRGAVYQLVLKGVLPKVTKHQRYGLDRELVEKLALERWQPGHPYWLTQADAARLLGISRTRVNQLIVGERLPAVSWNGRWFLRRPQLEVVANARDSRRSGNPGR